ncbi:hypothetical protein C2845_PM08G20670 [Panicum miliaceum]|uniref:VQ domain-containing protein n=1 Tax=Panicum miliaceum TaxID=4540 RepID=A0A3L6R0T8_PANMI|nr:hypothetical protein C2845_PM08G20670 [Panicum miliaceum]
MAADLYLVCDRTPDPGYKRQQVDARACLHCILGLEIARALVALSINVKRTRVFPTMASRGGEARPPAVKIIETVHVEADRSSFKSVVQRLTGRDAAAGDWSDRSSERRSDEAAAQGAGCVSRQADRHSCKEESS